MVLTDFIIQKEEYSLSPYGKLKPVSVVFKGGGYSAVDYIVVFENGASVNFSVRQKQSSSMPSYNDKTIDTITATLYEHDSAVQQITYRQEDEITVFSEDTKLDNMSLINYISAIAKAFKENTFRIEDKPNFADKMRACRILNSSAEYLRKKIKEATAYNSQGIDAITESADLIEPFARIKISYN